MIGAALGAWLALAAAIGAVGVAMAAVLTRSLPGACLYLIALGACVSIAVLALGRGDGAIGIALFTGAWAPVIVLASVALTVRTGKGKRRVPWFSIGAAAAIAAALAWAAPEIDAATPAAAALGAPWLGLLVFAGVLGCVGVLGYGERGALAPGAAERGE